MSRWDGGRRVSFRWGVTERAIAGAAALLVIVAVLGLVAIPGSG